MNLRQKVLTTLVAAFIVIILVLIAISSGYILSSYENLESNHVSGEVMLVRSHLDARVADIYVLAGDWAVWDDMYLYVSGKNPEFVEKNIHPEVLANLNINLLVITDRQGQIVYGTGFNASTGQMTPLPAAILAELADPASPFRTISDDQPVNGIITLPGHPMLIGAHPILHSDDTGPPAGKVIMGRYVDDMMIRSIGTSSRNRITLVPLSAGNQGDTPREDALPKPAGATFTLAETPSDTEKISVLVTPLDEEIVQGSTLISEIRGVDKLRLSVQMPRDIYQQGRSTIFSFILIVVNIALVIGIIVIWLINSLVLARLDSLNKDIDTLGKEGDLSKRLSVTGDDEISHLTASMNTTLGQLESAQVKLRMSEISYRTLVDTSPTGIAKTDLSGTIQFANRQMAESHGFDNVEELNGKFLFDLIAPPDRERAMMNLKLALREGQIRNTEYRGQKRDGRFFWLEMSVSLIRALNTEPESFIIVSRDISRRKERENQLRESEERYRTVFENTGTATVIIEENTIISLINSEFERLSGYTRAEVEGKMQWSAFVAADDLERMQQQHQLRRIAPGTTLKQYEFRFIQRSGSVRHIFLSVDMIPGTRSSIASLIDITDRKIAEDAIQHSEEQLNTIIDSSPIPQFVINRNHQVTHWNKALESLSGVPARDVIGTDHHWKAFYARKRPCIADLVVDGVIEKVSEYYPDKYTRSDIRPGLYEMTDFFPGLGDEGKWLYFSSTSIHDSRGIVTGAIEMFVDITERKKIEDEITKTNEQLNSTLQELRATDEMLNRKIHELEEAKQNLTRSEARYRDIATNIPGIVFQFVVRKEDALVEPFLGEMAFSRFTLGPDEVYSNPGALFNLIHNDDATYARTTLVESARTRTPWNIEFRMRPAKDIRWYNGRANPLTLRTGDTIWHGVLIDITERKLTEIALTASEQKFRAIFDQTFEFMGLMTPEGTLVQANRTAIELSGKDEPELIGRPFWEAPWWSHSPEVQDRLKTAILNVARGEFERFEVTHRSGSGTITYLDFSIKPVKDESGSVIFLIPEGRDITERKLLQEKIGAALREKELLLKEIHHRVKNNIQVIASLLNMQARTVSDPSTREVLREAQNRVKSIALVHEKLYQSKSLDRIEYHDYLQKIAHHLYESYGVSPRNVAMNIHADNISLHIDKAVPCSLIINELLSNAFKHAFPNDARGDIWIDIHRDGSSLVVQYRDNGVGLPEDISIERSESLGMRLLQGLTRQLHGTITIQRIGGTRITIIFPYDTGPEEGT